MIQLKAFIASGINNMSLVGSLKVMVDIGKDNQRHVFKMLSSQNLLQVMELIFIKYTYGKGSNNIASVESLLSRIVNELLSRHASVDDLIFQSNFLKKHPSLLGFKAHFYDKELNNSLYASVCSPFSTPVHKSYLLDAWHSIQKDDHLLIHKDHANKSEDSPLFKLLEKLDPRPSDGSPSSCWFYFRRNAWGPSINNDEDVCDYILQKIQNKSMKIITCYDLSSLVSLLPNMSYELLKAFFILIGTYEGQSILKQKTMSIILAKLWNNTLEASIDELTITDNDELSDVQYRLVLKLVREVMTPYVKESDVKQCYNLIPLDMLRHIFVFFLPKLKIPYSLFKKFAIEVFKDWQVGHRPQVVKRIECDDYFRILSKMDPDDAVNLMHSILQPHPNRNNIYDRAFELLQNMPTLSKFQAQKFIPVALDILYEEIGEESDRFEFVNLLIRVLDESDLEQFIEPILNTLTNSNNSEYATETLLNLCRKLPAPSVFNIVYSMIPEQADYSDDSFRLVLVLLNELFCHAHFYNEILVTWAFSRAILMTIPEVELNSELRVNTEISQQLEQLFSTLKYDALTSFIPPILTNLDADEPDARFAAIWVLNALLAHLTPPDIEQFIEPLSRRLDDTDVEDHPIRRSALKLIESNVSKFPEHAFNAFIFKLLNSFNCKDTQWHASNALKHYSLHFPNLLYINSSNHKDFFDRLLEQVQKSAQFFTYWPYVSYFFAALFVSLNHLDKQLLRSLSVGFMDSLVSKINGDDLAHLLSVLIVLNVPQEEQRQIKQLKALPETSLQQLVEISGMWSKVQDHNVVKHPITTHFNQP